MKTELARAKINLTLHVGRAIEDHSDPYYRYHPIDSLVVFSDVADSLTAQPASEMSLSITGPYAAQIPSGEDNLILKAIRAVQRATDVPPLAFHLEKNLTVSAGIGGGSANAAATLRLLKQYVDLDTPEHWDRIALGLGADVPVCMASQTCRMTGIGETLSPLNSLGECHAVLVNPGTALSTQDVFRAFDKGGALELPKPLIKGDDLLSSAQAGNNDLQPVSETLAPVIKDVIDALNACAGCNMARMSGSGTTCFGLFSSSDAAIIAAETILSHHPKWWTQPTRLGAG